jgi:hypothetical protein
MTAEASHDYTPHLVAVDIDGTTINHAREMSAALRAQNC